MSDLSPEDEISRLEHHAMDLLDKYADLARAVGAAAGDWWGDPVEPHSNVIRRAHALRDRIEKLEVVEKYAVHRDSCAVNYGPDGTRCNCGFDDALRGLTEAERRVAAHGN